MTVNWIQKALGSKTKGKLHKKLGVKSGEKIPLKKLTFASKFKGIL